MLSVLEIQFSVFYLSLFPSKSVILSFISAISVENVNKLRINFLNVNHVLTKFKIGETSSRLKRSFINMIEKNVHEFPVEQRNITLF